jgi:hypothetical protein
MQGVQNDKPQDRGLVYQAISQICNHPTTVSGSSFKFHLSYLEIYQENLRDLLVDEAEQGDLKIRMNPDDLKDLFVQGLTERAVFCEEDFVRAINIGTKRRVVGATNMNLESSRSHTILIIKIEQTESATGARKKSKIHLGMSFSQFTVKLILLVLKL